MVIDFALRSKLKQSIGVWTSLSIIRTRGKSTEDDMVTLRRCLLHLTGQVAQRVRRQVTKVSASRGH
jgi:hypothetical protein